jgi:hypothetical protein
VSIIQGPFSVAPCQTPISRFATLIRRRTPPYTPKGRTHELIITATPVVYREIKRRWSFLGYMSSAIDLYPLPRAQLPLSLTRSLSHAMSLCVVVQVEMLVSHAEALQCPICLDAPPSCPQVKRTSRLSFHAVNRRSRVGHGSDRKWPLNEGQRPHFRSVRVALGTGYDRVRGIGRALRNSGVSSSQQHAKIAEMCHPPGALRR